MSIFAFFFLFSQAQAANQYKLDPNHTNVFWSASHFGFSNPSGKFSDVEGVINLDESDPQSTAISVSIKTASVVTGIPAFDKHLQGGDFFNSDKFPTAQFISTKVLKGAQNNVTIVGDLNYLGVVKGNKSVDAERAKEKAAQAKQAAEKEAHEALIAEEEAETAWLQAKTKALIAANARIEAERRP